MSVSWSEFEWIDFAMASLLSVSSTFSRLYVGIVVSSVAVFRLVDNLVSSRLQIVHIPNFKFKLFAN